MRVLPRTQEDINEEWLDDKARYACDGLLRQRLDRPYIRENGKLKAATWDEALAAVAAKINGLSYSRLIDGLKKVGCSINRKILSELAIRDPNAFTAIAGSAKKGLAA